MNVHNVTDSGALVYLDHSELTAINNSLNSACGAVKVSRSDFETLVGVSWSDGRELLRQVTRLVDQVRRLSAERHGEEEIPPSPRQILGIDLPDV